MGRNVEVIVSFGGLHEKHAVQRGVLDTNSAFAGNTLLLCYTFRSSVRTLLETHYFSARRLRIQFVPHWNHTTSLLHI
jgi:hypothetical protein